MWRVELSGHIFDLETLQQQFPDGDPRVTRDGDRFYIESANLEARAPNHDEVLEHTQLLLARMNGVAQLVAQSHRAVTASGHIIGPDAHEHVVIQVDSIEVRSKVGNVTIEVGNEEPPPPPAPVGQALYAAAGSDDAENALRLLGTRPLDWVNLYRILDCVRHAFGGTDRIEAAGLATKAELSRFTHTANSQKAIGDKARHGPTEHQSPKIPMTLEEATTLIRSILKKWLAP